MTSASEVENAKRQIRKSLYICAVAFMMNYAAYGGLVFLQSSINIEEGLGTKGLVTVYATSAFSTILFIPLFIDFKGAKAAIVAGEIGILIYTLANFYPSWYTIIPAAICHGVTESASWAGTSCYVTYLGEKYSELIRQQKQKSKRAISKESCVYWFFSIFYVFAYFSQVLGSAIVSIVLYGLRDKTVDADNYMFSNTSKPNASVYTVSAITVNTTSDDSWALCGANYCQEGIDAEQLSKYKPSLNSIYCLLALFAGMQITFTAVHALALPTIPSKYGSHSLCHTPIHHREAGLIKICNQGIVTAVKSELKQTFQHIVSPLHLCIFPLVFYSGVYIAFAMAEFPRAFVSCTIGVEFVGFVAMVYGLSSMAMSATSTKLIPLLGRNVFISTMYLFHITTFLLCLLWSPSMSMIWLIFAASACLGACDGIMTNIAQGMFATYFEDKLAIAFSVKNLANNLGIVAGTGWSELFCVDVKLYILFGLLLLSAGTYAFAEKMYRTTKYKDLPVANHSTNNRSDLVSA
uniref:Protein unc-93 homolog A n=1 Tax=Phallusia mammillata TaxID=59560 RepID=A0A6F9DVR6_9ASCI|nr:protein unc-93 homolog A [Phallusia mammillata]